MLMQILYRLLGGKGSFAEAVDKEQARRAEGLRTGYTADQPRRAADVDLDDDESDPDEEIEVTTDYGSTERMTRGEWREANGFDRDDCEDE